MMHQGPLPPPSYLQRYEDAVPGSAKLIVTMAEREQTHRHKITTEQERFPRRGQYMAFLLLGGALFLAWQAITMGYPVQAAWIVGTALGAGAATEFFRRRVDAALAPPSERKRTPTEQPAHEALPENTERK